MTKIKNTTLGVLTVAALFSASAAAQTNAQQVVYSNIGGTHTLAHYSNLQFGDEISLAPGYRTISTFEFEYAATLTDGGTYSLQFYNMDGPLSLGKPGPGTPFYSSGVQNLSAGSHSVTVSGLAVDAPTTFAWTISFGGLTGTEKAGLFISETPTIGAALPGGKIGSFDDFWVNNGGTWQLSLIQSPSTPANFVARVTAVPEPSTVATLALGLRGLGLVAYRRNTR